MRKQGTYNLAEQRRCIWLVWLLVLTELHAVFDSGYLHGATTGLPIAVLASDAAGVMHSSKYEPRRWNPPPGGEVGISPISECDTKLDYPQARPAVRMTGSILVGA